MIPKERKRKMPKHHKWRKKHKEAPKSEEHHRKRPIYTARERPGNWLVAPPVSEFDMIRIYEDKTKLSLVERYLKIIYRPFTCTAQTGNNYALAELACFLPNSIYEPDKHPALVLRLSNPTCSVRVSHNGAMSCQAFSYESVVSGILRSIGTMEQFSYKPLLFDTCLNVVNATFCMPFGINLIEIFLEYRNCCIYSYDADAHIIFKMQNSSIKFALFASGFIYVLLSSHMRYTQKAIAFIMPILFRHRQPGIAKYPHADLSIGDLRFKLLWENKFQLAYQDTLKYFKFD